MTTFDGTPVSQSAFDTFAQQMRERGLDPGPTLAKHGAQQSSSPAPLPEPSPLAPDLNAAKHTRLSDSQLKQAADNLSQHWTGDPQVLRETLERMGLTAAGDVADPRTDLQQQFDATLGAPANGDDYELQSLFVNRGDMPADDRAELGGAIRSAMNEMGVPKVLGPAVAGYLLDGVEQWNAVKADPVSIQRYHAEQQALTCRVLKTSWQDVIDTVKPFVQKMSTGSKALFAPSGAFEHAPLLIHLYRSAELLTIRRGLERTR